ncbi:hypothetical protein [Halonatronum saccharophilum]|uniref:hypothetical protein n=1 Tax=Halonatronum saccharophilum TaxID=150060 RepID=UPI00048300BE|nr:hypothetical protein [Halonatronum saccharophilum]
MSEYKAEIEVIKNKLDRANKLRDKAIFKLENLKEQRKELLKEIEEFGVKPENLDSEIKELEKELKLLITKAKDLLPNDAILDGKKG